MEKLQQALQKAREQRTSAQPSQANATQPSAPSLWEALTAHEPDAQTLEAARIVSTTVNQMSSAFDVLRTKTLLTMGKNNWCRLGITSPTADCGKTTTALNLALGFARQPDLRACLFELDLRRPTIAKCLQLPDNRPDISPMLAGEIPFGEQAVRFRDNVCISAATRSSSDPSSVLLNRATAETLNQIETDYKPDIMIFDLPPLLSSDEARALIKDVDCVLIVARAEKTTVSQLDSCESEIAEQTNILGISLNQCRHSDDMHDAYGVAGN